MTWVKLDDKLHAHPKVRRAWKACPASLGLHVLALSHAGSYFPPRHPQAGHVPEEFVAERMPKTLRQKAVKALVDARLWEPVDGGWQIHGFLDANPPTTRSRQNGAGGTPPLFDLIPASRARAQARTPAGASRVPPRPAPLRSPSHPSISEASA